MNDKVFNHGQSSRTKTWTKPPVDDYKQGQKQTQTRLVMPITERITKELSLITTVKDASLKR